MMHGQRAVGAGAILLLLVATASPQEPAKAAANAAQPPAQTAPPSADAMGVSLKNIRQQVPQTAPSERRSGSGLRYDFFVDVFGKRPAIEFFREFDLSTGGPVRWGGVTHQEILNAVTPYPFRGTMMGGYDVLSGGKKK
jgi:hypothetical protein